MISQQQKQQQQQQSEEEGEEESNNNKRRKQQPVLVLSNNTQPIYLNEDWNYGIGGGLWSMGIALAKYFDTDHSQNHFRRIFASNNNQSINVLELGSGNGFLSVCLLATLRRQQQNFINDNNNNNSKITVRITDTSEHLPLIHSTLKANNYVKNDDDIFYSISDSSSNNNNNYNNNIKIYVEEYVWGNKQQSKSKSQKKYDDDQDQEKEENYNYYDLIIGSDLAYRDELHDILIESILDCSTPGRTVTLLGVTMNDTKPIFFKKLSKANLQYERLADHLIDPEYRGSQFGIFVITKKEEKKK